MHALGFRACVASFSKFRSAEDIETCRLWGVGCIQHLLQ